MRRLVPFDPFILLIRDQCNIVVVPRSLSGPVVINHRLPFKVILVAIIISLLPRPTEPQRHIPKARTLLALIAAILLDYPAVLHFAQSKIAALFRGTVALEPFLRAPLRGTHGAALRVSLERGVCARVVGVGGAALWTGGDEAAGFGEGGGKDHGLHCGDWEIALFEIVCI